MILKFPLSLIYYSIFGVNWFKLQNVNLKYVWNHSERNLKQFDCIIATSITTAYRLNSFELKGKNKIYFIQAFEDWVMSSEDVYKSFKFPFKKIVIADWLKDKVESIGEHVTVIPNGFDFDYFQLTKPLTERNKYSIAMMYHTQPLKGTYDALEALKIVREKIPDLHVTLFSSQKLKENIPSWCTFVQSPNKELHNKIYNEASIFVSASHSEGFGLTVGEAMICGCAIVCTDNGGFRMMVKDGVTGLLSPVTEIDRLAHNIIELIENQSLRIRLAQQGNDFIHSFDWNSSVQKFLSVINND